MHGDYIIASMRDADWEAVRAVYLEGIATGQATFETVAPDWPAWNTAHRADCRLVARHDRQVIGWAALNPVSKRSVYSGVAEVSVYVAAAARGQGVGRHLDASSKHLPEERSQPGVAPVVRLSHRRSPRARGPSPGRLARHTAPGASQQ